MPSLRLLDADASRPPSGVLTPSSEGSLNSGHGSSSGFVSPGSGSRTRADAVAMDRLLKPPIAVKPHPPNLHVQPLVLLPLMLLPREHLPLACIDLAASDNGLPPSRFYESHVKILDLESRLGSAPSILIARNEPKGTVYALERQQNGLCVMCKLGPWLDLDSLARKATALSRQRLRPAHQGRREQVAVDALTTPQIYKAQKKKREAIAAIQSLVRKRPRSESVPVFEDAATRHGVSEPESSSSLLPALEETREQQTEPGLASFTPTTDPSPRVDLVAESAPQHTTESIFDNIRTQYFEALYRSMGSLAYFAKGPLSRARSAFHLDLESNLDMADLIDFLKSLVLTTVQIDKKYRETIPDVISRMKQHVESSDDNGKRRSRCKKMKLGRDGLYPLEEESIRKWWAANRPQLDDSQASYSTSQIKSHASLLRTRETQLQMIIILEILALEPLKAAGEAAENSLPLLPGVSQPQEQPMPPPPPPKKRNKHNLPVLIDVHADRLAIWQSTASDEQLLLEDSQVSQAAADGQVQQKASSEPLKDFCVDVIVPFFSARLPDLCDSINRKLGGPVILFPLKSKSSKRSSSKREQKPGAVTKRPGPANPRRTLQRALSTEQQYRRSVSRGPGSAIALMRSAASTSVAGVKREGSEPVVSLKALPKGEPQPSRLKQPSLARSSSMTNLMDAKASKKALAEAELKDAISALRKPNRDVVGKAMAEEEERRALARLSAKKVKRVPRGSLASAVQVKATPTNARYKDALAVKLEASEDVPLRSTEEAIPPSSIGHLVPSTGPRVGHRDAFMSSASPAAELVGGTPVRPTVQSGFLRRLAYDEPAMPPLSPLVSKTTRPNRAMVSGSAVKPRVRLSFSPPPRVVATPVKRGAPRPEPDESARPAAESVPKLSIYQKLGWDDDFDDL